MKKRLGFISLFGITALLIVMVGAIAALAAPSAAVTGTIEMDRAWYTNSGAGATVDITVEDADANVPVSETNAGLFVILDAEGAGQFVQLSPDFGFTDANNLVGTPVVVPMGGTTADAYDDTEANFTVTNAALGRGTLSVDGVTVSNGDLVDIIYNVSEVDTVDVKVTSTQDPTGFTVVATETGFDSGKFEATIALDADATSVTTTPKQLRALNTNSVTASYKDETPSSGTSVTVKATATIETSDPSFASLSPDDGFSTQAQQPQISGTINDVGGSGIDVSTATITIKTDPGGGVVETATPSVTGSDGDSTVTFKFTPAALAEGSYTWQVTVSDIAGNAASSDSDDDTAGDQPHDLKIDLSPPDFVSAATGKAWDTEDSAEDDNKLNSLVVVFDEKLDSNSVTASDFTVDGAVPADAQVFSKASTKVYITLASDMAADDEPTVAIVGAVADKAGNARNTGSIDAADEIDPTFTVTLDKTLTNDKVVISISANEPIAGVPEIKVHNEDVGVPAKTLSAIVKGTTSWEATFTESAAYEGDNGVVVTGLDGSGNQGTAGKTDPSDTKAIDFEQDTTDPAIVAGKYEAGGVDITAASPEVTSVNPFITIGFDEKVTVTEAEFGVDGSTLDDVTSDGKASSDRKTWIFAAAGLEVGEEYTINVTFEDDAGNETEDADATFEVTEKPKVEIDVKPGMNLISFPGQIANGDISVVIDNPDVTEVTTYDPTNPNPETGSPWLSATRNADGTWDTSGGLTTIDSGHAYWVKTSSFAPVKADIPDLGFAATPPSIEVVAGWNLVPITSLTGTAPGTAISADTYFGSLPGWVTAYSFDPQTNNWTKVLPKNFDTVEVGVGYWLYVNAPGILVP